MNADLNEIERYCIALGQEWHIWNGREDSEGARALRIGPNGSEGITGALLDGDLRGSPADFERVVVAVNALPSLIQRIRDLEAERFWNIDTKPIDDKPVLVLLADTTISSGRWEDNDWSVYHPEFGVFVLVDLENPVVSWAHLPQKQDNPARVEGGKYGR